jgi:hypothetical protein
MPFIPANAIEGAITIAVLVIAFIGWLVQMAGQAKGPQPPANRPRPAMPPGNGPPVRRDKSLQSEIDSFLREVGSTRKPVSKEVEEDIEIIEDDEEVAAHSRPMTSRLERAPTSPPVVAEVRPQAAGTPSAWDVEHQKRRERFVSSVSERHLESTPLGVEMRKHVDEYLAESAQLRREKERVERSLADANAQLRAIRAATPASEGGIVRRGEGRSAVVSLLKDKRSIKDAIIINEILAKPLALRAEPR